MPDVRHVRERLSGAVEALSAKDGSLRERLALALESLGSLQSADMPTETMQNDFAILMEEVTASRADGDVDASRTALSAAGDVELQDMAQVVVDLHKASIAAEVRGDTTLGV